MNTDYKDRNRELPEYLKVFPYVNGGLFRNTHTAPFFTNRSRRMLIEAGSLQWSDINPDIFGSMIQAVVTPEHRGGLGMHYTSVPNIMKVIEPLFLNELRDEFDAIVETRRLASQNNADSRSIASFQKLLKRIWKIKIFDPACGSGNFLIIAYKKLRELEMDIFKELGTFAFSEINLDSFYGIELDDFAHEVATLSLWLAEHQMNQVFKARFGDVKPALPLKQTGNIVHGNACRVDWETVCPKNEGDEIYILGNPPYLGSRNQDNKQKEDMQYIFKDSYKSLDYIACWFYKGAKFIENFNSQCSFVSTNSICQGEQVALLWPLVLNKLEIGYAFKSFVWQNNAKNKAAVIVVIIGLRNKSRKNKLLFDSHKVSQVSNINPYLTTGNSEYIVRRSKPISCDLQKIVYGNLINDNGFLVLSEEDKNKLICQFPNSIKYIHLYIGSKEFICGERRYCIYIKDHEIQDALAIPEIKRRIEAVRNHRQNSTENSTRLMANQPHKFYFQSYNETESIIIPRTSSENRFYIPIGYLSKDIIISDAAQAIYEAKTYIFSIVSSRIHMTWVRAVAGRLKSDYRYSSALCYNTFPFPPISDNQKQELEQHTYNIISERERHSEKTLAELYDPDKMPDGLREAHRLNDLAVERCYRSRPFESDEERLEYLFKLYEQMIAEEKQRVTLFEGEKTKKSAPKPPTVEIKS